MLRVSLSSYNKMLIETITITICITSRVIAKLMFTYSMSVMTRWPTGLLCCMYVCIVCLAVLEPHAEPPELPNVTGGKLQ